VLGLGNSSLLHWNIVFGDLIGNSEFVKLIWYCAISKERGWTVTDLNFKVATWITDKLIKSYLQGRYQRAVLNNHSSSSCWKWGEITHSVLQGWILGPLLFLLYISDLPQINKNSKIVLFKDDTSMIITNPSPSNFEKSVNKTSHDITELFNTYYQQTWIKHTSYNLWLRTALQ
jgi:hypothetical protein